MKKHYEKMCMTPLGFVIEGSLLAGSVGDTVTAQTSGQELEYYDFSSDDSFNVNWE